MVNAEIFNTKIKCTLCDFEIILTGTQKHSSKVMIYLINNHKGYSSECSAYSIKDFVISNVNKNNKYSLDIYRLVELKTTETNKLVNDIIDNDITCKNRSYIDNIKSPFNEYNTNNKCEYIGLLLIKNMSMPSINIINTIIEVLLGNTEYIEKYNFLVLNINDFTSPTKTVGDSELKIKSIFNTIKKSNELKFKKTILIIDNIDNLISGRNTRIDSEKINSIVTEFEKIYNDKSMYIILIGTDIKRMQYLENRFEIAKFK